MSYTLYPLPSGGHTDNYQHFKDAKADHAAAQARFHAAFGEQLSTPEGRRAAAAAMREVDPHKSGSVMVMPVQPKYQGGMSETEVERRVDAGMSGVVNSRGGVDFPIPAMGAPRDVAEVLPAGLTRVSFFGGMPIN